MMTQIESLAHNLTMRGQKFGVRIMPWRWPKVFEGQQPAIALCQYIIRKKHQHVLLMTSKTPLRTGLVQPLIDELQGAGIKVTIHDDTRPDPTVEQIEDAVSLIQSAGCDAILVLGGGSCMDAAKVVAARAKNPGKSILQMAGMLKVSRGMLPLYAIPTTAGTGSEVTLGAVVTDTQAQRKLPIVDPRVMPRAAALDGSLMLGVPQSITAATGMDALTHAVEAYISRNALKRTDLLAMEAVQLIMSNLQTAVADGSNLTARQNMARASFLAGKAFTQVGVGYVHAIAHNFGAMYHLPHGRANAIIMPYVLDYSLPRCTRRLAELARGCELADPAIPDREAAEIFIAKIRSLNQEFDIPQQVDDLKEEHIRRIAQQAREEARFTYAVPKYMSQRDCESLIRQMLPRAA